MSRASPDAEHAAAFLLARCQQEWRTIDALLSSPSRHCRPELPEVVQSLRRLCAVVVEDDELSPPDALGACTEYIVRQNVPNDLLGLCMADEPHGVLAELIRTLVIWIRRLPSPFLANERVIRTLIQILHFSLRSEQAHLDSDIIELVYAIALRVHQQPDVLQLFVRLGSHLPKDRLNDRFPLLVYILRHIHIDGEHGRHMRTSLVWLIHALLSVAGPVSSPAMYLDHHICTEIARSLNEAIATSYDRLPMFPVSPSASYHEAWVYERFPASTVRWPISTCYESSALGTFIDSLWLIQSIWCICSSCIKPDPLADQLDILVTSVLEQFKTLFVRPCLQRALDKCYAAAETMCAMLYYTDILYSVLEPCTPLSRCLCVQNDERCFADIIHKGLQDSSSHTLAYALRAAQTWSRWTSWHDATPGTRPLSEPHSCMAFSLVAMAEQLQVPKNRASFSHRFLTHLTSVEQTMRDDPMYYDVPGMNRRSTYKPLDVFQQHIGPGEYFLQPLTKLLRHWFSAPLEQNIRVIDAFASLCRSPLLNIDGLLHGVSTTPPILTFYLYMLYNQCLDFHHHMPDFSFYLSQRKVQRLGTPLPEKYQPDYHSACPLFHSLCPETGIDSMEQSFRQASWMPPDLSHTTSFAIRTSTSDQSQVSTSSLDGALHILVSVSPCSAPASGPWYDPAVYGVEDVPLVNILDNVILLEEVLLEMACIASLRHAWGIDRPCSYS